MKIIGIGNAIVDVICKVDETWREGKGRSTKLYTLHGETF